MVDFIVITNYTHLSVYICTGENNYNGDMTWLLTPPNSYLPSYTLKEIDIYLLFHIYIKEMLVK